MGRITDTVKALLIINIVVFFGSNFLIPNVASDLFALWFPKHPNFQIWQPLTHMFMHAPLVKGELPSHLLFNMFALYMFGSHIEQALGQQKFLFLYFSAGFGAAALQIVSSYFQFLPAYNILIEQGLNDEGVQLFIKNIIETGQYTSYDGLTQTGVRNMIEAYLSSMLGASGAIFGVLVAFAVLYPNLPLYMMFIPIPIKAKYLIGGYFLLDVYAAVTGNNIIGPANTANWAHIGGAIIGFIIIWYWKKNSFNNRRWD